MMRDYYCPHCGRWLAASDAPPGHVIKVPACKSCKDRDRRAVVLRTEQEYAPRRSG